MNNSLLDKTPVSMPFKLKNPRNDRVAEFDVFFNKDRNNFDKFLEFIDLYSDRRININFRGEQFPTNIALSIQKVSDNTYIKLAPEQIPVLPELQENNCRYFLSSATPAYNFISLESLIDLGVSDIYPADDLVYNLRDTKILCDYAGIGMRLVCNRIPSTALNRGTDYKSPLFAPQNRALLDEYFSCYEFDCGNPYDWAKFDVLYRAWFEREGWNGDLMEINDDLRLSFPLLAVPQSLTSYKLSCKHHCSRPKNRCDRCKQYVDIGMNLVDMGAYIKSNKKHLKMGKE